MSKPSESELNRFARRVDELRQEVSRRDPFILANHTATTYQRQAENQGAFSFKIWANEVVLSYPELVASQAQTGKELSLFEQAMLLYYFRIADGYPVSGQWISFSELADGRFYNQAFQGYTGQELARAFQDNRTAFERAAKSLGGIQQPPGDAAFAFQALPRVSLLVVFWQGDEDFPSSFQMLFDVSADHYLPTDAYAILGSTLTRRLIKAASSPT